MLARRVVAFIEVAERKGVCPIAYGLGDQGARIPVVDTVLERRRMHAHQCGVVDAICFLPSPAVSICLALAGNAGFRPGVVPAACSHVGRRTCSADGGPVDETVSLPGERVGAGGVARRLCIESSRKWLVWHFLALFVAILSEFGVA